jgi:hypothetical protein
MAQAYYLLAMMMMNMMIAIKQPHPLSSLPLSSVTSTMKRAIMHLTIVIFSLTSSEHPQKPDKEQFEASS